MSASFTFNSDTGEMSRRIQLVTEKFPGAVGRALQAEMEIEKKESIRRTPWKYHNLQNSHEVHEPEQTARLTRVRITVGGPTAEAPAGAPYAIYVHENPFAHHPHGQWKFLESTLRESRPYMAERVAKRLQDELNDSIR